MAIYKCKMCGGTLEIGENQTVAECEYCGTKQTVPTSKDENLQGLFNRANVLRMKSEFDKAEQIYEKIIQSKSDEAEAYWGLILCKFGIEYVEDPATFKRIPTCHRTSFDSIISDDDYKSALAYADVVSRSVYEAEAKEIDRIQKEILALSKKEQPYDVFICYKETDESGKRSQDSVIANDIYYQLTQEGFKVFYAAITLEDKLGSAYEPCIFAALNSAKVMLSIGTKPEYFNAVWVKNEWSRYLKMMKKDRSKMLIPCYKDMDAYELPEEFAHLQAQDMSKIGFINDIVRGIKKVLQKDEPAQQTAQATSVIQSASSANTDSLLKRAFMFLEDGDWNSADEYCEKVLDIEPENAQAYVGKLMAELKVHRQADLVNCAYPFDNRNSYKKAVRFASPELRDELEGYVDFINKRREEERVSSTYNRAKSILDSAKSEDNFKEAAGKFAEIPEYKDSKEFEKQCLEKAEIARKDDIYNKAKAKMHEEKSSSQNEAIKLFEMVSGWKDADNQIAICQKKIEEIKLKEEADRIEAERKSEEERKAEAKKNAALKAKKKKNIMICCAILILIPVLLITFVNSSRKSNEDRILQALAGLESGDARVNYNEHTFKVAGTDYNPYSFSAHLVFSEDAAQVTIEYSMKMTEDGSLGEIEVEETTGYKFKYIGFMETEPIIVLDNGVALLLWYDTGRKDIIGGRNEFTADLPSGDNIKIDHLMIYRVY